jgi:hypothetical protein
VSFLKKKIKEPKDLGIKIIPAEQALWEDVVLSIKKTIKNLETDLILQKAMLEKAIEKRDIEKDTYINK